jgi:hypothetical protein
MGERKYNPTLLDLDTGWRCGQLHVPAGLLPGKLPWYPFERRLGVPQSRSRRCGEEKNLASAGDRTPAVQPIVRSYTD